MIHELSAASTKKSMYAVPVGWSSIAVKTAKGKTGPRTKNNVRISSSSLPTEKNKVHRSFFG
jgi:hypothetical protein